MAAYRGYLYDEIDEKCYDYNIRSWNFHNKNLYLGGGQS
jgi:hypothetical protein